MASLGLGGGCSTPLAHMAVSSRGTRKRWRDVKERALPFLLSANYFLSSRPSVVHPCASSISQLPLSQMRIRIRIQRLFTALCKASRTLTQAAASSRYFAGQSCPFLVFGDVITIPRAVEQSHPLATNRVLTLRRQSLFHKTDERHDKEDWDMMETLSEAT
ncbi:hypothetical protein BKA81DRAFT_350902 [Phyllosticta paracitricarpa]